MKSHLQFTLRELLVVIAFAALGLAALAKGGIVGAITVSLAVVVTMCLAIVAFVGRREKQAFAIGFLIPVVMYAAVVLAVGKSELDPNFALLPTSKLLRLIYSAIAKQTWVDEFTGKVIVGYDPTKVSSLPSGFGYTAPMRLVESLDHGAFMSIGHILAAMTLGYAGAKFAVLVHRRESKDNALRAGQGSAIDSSPSEEHHQRARGDTPRKKGL